MLLLCIRLPLVYRPGHARVEDRGTTLNVEDRARRGKSAAAGAETVNPDRKRAAFDRLAQKAVNWMETV
ncbi:MAG: hypothetical protein ACLGPM_09725 [Acidobacteriota bacterium]